MPIPATLLSGYRAPRPMPELPHEVVDMIFKAFELLISAEEAIHIERPEWHAAAAIHEAFDIDYSRFIILLNRHLSTISLISRFWCRIVNLRRLHLPIIVKSFPASNNIQLSSKIDSITNVVAQLDGEHTLAQLLSMGRDTLESITLYQGLVKTLLSPQVWDSLSQVQQLKELTVNQSLSIPLPSLFNLLHYCWNLKALRIFSFGTGPLPQSDPQIDKFHFKEQTHTNLTHLTCHILSIPTPSHQFRLCNSLNKLLKKVQVSLEILTLVFETIWSNQNHLDDGEEQDEYIQKFISDYFCEILRGFNNLQTLNISTPDEMPSVPFMDRTIYLFPVLEHLHLKGNSFSPELFTTNVLPGTLKTLGCQAYSRPISTLIRAIRNSLSHQSNLQSLTITTYRQKPRNFREAIYGELDLPDQTNELTMEELLLWDQSQSESIIEQKLLIQECQLRSIKLDGPRPYIPHHRRFK